MRGAFRTLAVGTATAILRYFYGLILIRNHLAANTAFFLRICVPSSTPALFIGNLLTSAESQVIQFGVSATLMSRSNTSPPRPPPCCCCCCPSTAGCPASSALSIDRCSALVAAAVSATYNPSLRQCLISRNIPALLHPIVQMHGALRCSPSRGRVQAAISGVMDNVAKNILHLDVRWLRRHHHRERDPARWGVSERGAVSVPLIRHGAAGSLLELCRYNDVGLRQWAPSCHADQQNGHASRQGALTSLERHAYLRLSFYALQHLFWGEHGMRQCTARHHRCRELGCDGAGGHLP
ncbi:hypothetical protein Q4I28_001906 [Leishmania naiffi]|uniref:Uncharacterized protein n=1 Tax=Leishmania naiffi TaxID=5678 RepID=A0AAW3C3X6_9TRYP